jgi:hypothetical protein
LKFAKDISASVGLAALSIGLWIERPALALVVVGSLLLMAGVYGHLRANAPVTQSEGKDDS